MKKTLITKLAMGAGAAVLALTVPAVTSAYASTFANVPCSGSGGGTVELIAAINAANVGGGGAIDLAPGCTYTLTTVNNTPSPMIGGNGLPMITSQITVSGLNSTIMRSPASVAAFRIFEVTQTGNLTLQGVTISGGLGTFGGGILNSEGVVTLDNSQVTDNTASGAGGGIASGVLSMAPGPIGTLTLNSSEVNDNTALATMMGGGGGILNHSGTAILNSSQVSHNVSDGGGGGIASGTAGSTGGSVLDLTSTQVEYNAALGGPMAGAGGISNGGTASITSSQITGNSAPDSFGGGVLNHGVMTIDLSRVSYNSASGGSAPCGMPPCGGGGGIADLNFMAPDSGVLSLYQSTVNGNSSPGVDTVGGGLLAEGGTVSMSGDSVTSNSSGSKTGGGIGGGIALFESSATVSAGLVADNLALGIATSTGEGGGIYVDASSILNVTGPTGIDTNFATVCGGGIYVQSGGGGTLNGTTVQSNQVGAENGGGGVYGESSYGSSLTIDSNAVVCHNKADGSPNDRVFGDGPCGTT